MPTDYRGEEVTLSRQDLLGPTGRSKESEIVKKLTDSMEKGQKQNEELTKTMGEAVKAVEGMNKKLEDLEKAQKKTMEMAKSLELRAPSKKSTAIKDLSISDVEASVEKGVEKALGKDAARGLANLASEHTVATKNKGLEKLAEEMVKLLGQLQSKFGELSASMAASAPGRPKPGGAPAGPTPTPADVLTGAVSTASMEEANDLMEEFKGTHEEVLEQEMLAADGMEKWNKALQLHIARLNQSKSITKKILADWLGDHKDTNESQKKAIVLSSQLEQFYSKRHKAQLKHLENQLAMSDEGENRDQAMKAYLDHLEKANELALVHSRTQTIVASRWEEILKGLDEGVRKWTAALIAVDIEGAFSVEKAIKSQAEYLREIRLTRFVQGELSSDIERSVLSREAIYRTGKDYNTVLKTRTKIVRAGIKDAKVANKMALGALKLSTMINSDAEQTAEMMRKWKMHLKLSTTEMGMVNREIQHTAKTTGLVGENLLEAAKATEKLLINLRDIGGESAEAAGHLSRLVGEAQKLGVEGEMGESLDLLTKGSDNFIKALQQGPGTALLLLKAGEKAGFTFEEIASGVVGRSEDLMEQLFEKRGEVIDEYFGSQITDFGRRFSQSLGDRRLEVANINDLFKVTEKFGRHTTEYKEASALISQLDLQAQATFKMSVGKLGTIQEAANRANMSFADRLKELEEKRTKYMTDVEKANLDLERASLMFAEASKAMDKGFTNSVDSLATLLVEQNKFGSETEARAHLSRISAADRQEAVQRMGMEAQMAAAQQARDAAMAAGAWAGEVGEVDQFTPENLSRIMAIQNPQKREKQLGDLREAIDNSISKSEMAAQSLQNPTERSARYLNRIQGMLQDSFGWWMSKMAIWLAPLGIMVGSLSTLVLQGIALARFLWGLMPVVREMGMSVRGLFLKASTPGSIYTNDMQGRIQRMTMIGLLRQISLSSALGGRGMGRVGRVAGVAGGARAMGGARSVIPLAGTAAGLPVGTMIRGGGAAKSVIPLAGSAAGLKTGTMIRGGGGGLQLVGGSTKGLMTAQRLGGAGAGAGGLQLVGGSTKGLATAQKLGAGAAVKGVAGATLKYLGPAMMAVMGGAMGVMEANAANERVKLLREQGATQAEIEKAEAQRVGLAKGEGVGGKIESAVLGVLTGGTRTESMLGSMVGAKQGTALNEAIGVGGAAASGALIGTMIAPGIGTAIGAALGAGGQIYKIATKEGSPLRKWFVDNADSITNVLQRIPGPIGQITNAFGAAANAADIFGVEQEKVTTGMRLTAGAAGLATGGLNALTFGVFKKHLGPQGSWTKWIANLFVTGDKAKDKSTRRKKDIFAQRGFTAPTAREVSQIRAMEDRTEKSLYVQRMFGTSLQEFEKATKNIAKVQSLDTGGVVTKGGLAKVDKNEIFGFPAKTGQAKSAGERVVSLLTRIHLTQLQQFRYQAMEVKGSSKGIRSLKYGAAGAVAGMLLGGPVGAVIGAAVGAEMGRREDKRAKSVIPLTGSAAGLPVGTMISPRVPGEDGATKTMGGKLRERRVADSKPETEATKRELKGMRKNTDESVKWLKQLADDLRRFIEFIDKTPPNMYDSQIEPGDPRPRKVPRGSLYGFGQPDGAWTALPSHGPVPPRPG